MKTEELIPELKRMVSGYMSPEDASEILPDVEKDKVRYVLFELGERKIKPITNEDCEIIKDLVFNFG